MTKVIVKASQKIYFEQLIEVTPEELELLKPHQDGDIKLNSDAAYILDLKMNLGSPSNWDDYEDFELLDEDEEPIE